MTPSGHHPEVPLSGGVANAGRVVRVDHHVLRPTGPHTPAVHRLLAAVRATGFDGVPDVVGVDADGRERLVFVPGDVAQPPYPASARTDEALASVTRLLTDYHRAAALVTTEPPDAGWTTDLADPAGGPIVCHNDVCLENVVFRDGEAVALLDFDLAAPGRRAHDVAAMARMCVPVDEPHNAERLGWEPADLAGRLRLVADVASLDATERAILLTALDHTIANGAEFVLRHVRAGHPGFTAMFERMGGTERFDRRRDWWRSERPAFVRALS